jgi:hypothetical protein
VDFEIVGPIINMETIAVHGRIRQRRRLNRMYGRGMWRKLKGVGIVRLEDDRIYLAEIHWYEAHGIGKKEIKIKRLLEQAG